MSQPWKLAAFGGSIGACLAAAAIFAAAYLGVFPGLADRQFHDYLMAHPKILIAMQDKMQNDEALAEEESVRKEQAVVDKLGLKAFFNPNVAFITGPANAKKTIVEFFDYNCGHCRASFPAMLRYYSAHKDDTRFAFIEFPIFGADSDSAARVAIAARHQPDKYVAFHFALMGEQLSIDRQMLFDDAKKVGLDTAALDKDSHDPRNDATIAAARKLADSLSIAGTPNFIINGRVHSGEVNDELLDQLTKS